MAGSDDPFPELGSVYKNSGPQVNQLIHNIANINLNSTQVGDYKVAQTTTSNVWGRPNVAQKLGMWGNGGSGKGNRNEWTQQTKGSWQNISMIRQPVVSTNTPPLDQGSYRSPTQSMDSNNGQLKDEINKNDDQMGVDDDIDDESGAVYDSDDDDDDLSNDDYDSEKKHEMRKKSKWFWAFFEDLDKVNVEELNSLSRKWHCPACQGGPGAIDWYRGLEPLMHHARTKAARRAKLHRVFAEILYEELRRRGTSVSLAGEAYGRWEGLNEKVKDHQIVWPPMVIIMNTRDEQDENNKWIGMGNQELLDYFSSYAALKARHSYGPQGHRGMSVLIFETSPAGFLEAARLHKHFKEQGRDRDAWDCQRALFIPGGKRQLYGYIGMKKDLDIFNQHSQGKSKLKFEMRSYQEMVESKIKHINDDSQQLNLFKERVAKEKRQSQALAESLCKISEKLRKTSEENRIVRQRTRMQHEQNKEEMDAQEQFFKDQITIIQQAIDAKEDGFEKLQQDKREKVKQLKANPSKIEDHSHRMEEITRFIKFQDKEMEQFEVEREKLIKIHEDMKIALKRQYWEEEVGLEKKFENELTQLMEKYTPTSSSEKNCT